jgi:hypothetical protein
MQIDFPDTTGSNGQPYPCAPNCASLDWDKSSAIISVSIPSPRDRNPEAMSSKKDSELLRGLWAPFYIAGGSLNNSKLKELAPRECTNDEHITMDALVECVEAQGQVRQCIRNTLKTMMEDWLSLAPATRAEISKLARDNHKLFADLPDVPAEDLARLRMPWQIADALYADRRKKTFSELLDGGLDLDNGQLAHGDVQLVGKLSLTLAGTLDSLLEAKLDVDLAAVVLAEPAHRAAIEKDVVSRANVEIQGWYAKIHAAWASKNLAVPNSLIDGMDTLFKKRLGAVSSTQPSSATLNAVNPLLPERERQEQPPPQPARSPERPRPFLQRPLFWVGGAIVLGIAGLITETTEGTLNLAVPSPTEIACVFSHPFEKRVNDDSFTVLILPFRGETDRAYSSRVADSIRGGTGLSVIQSCKIPSYPQGTFSDIDQSVGKQAMDELEHHNADVVVWGEVAPGEDALSLHYRNQYGLDNSPYRHDTVRVTELSDWLDPDCVRKESLPENANVKRSAECFLGRKVVTDSAFSSTVFQSSDYYSFPPLAIAHNPPALLRLAKKFSSLSGSSYGENHLWPAFTLARKHFLEGAEGDLRARYALATGDASEANQGLVLVEQALDNEEQIPTGANTRALSIFHAVALEAAVRETKNAQTADKFIQFARDQIASGDTLRKQTLGIALALRWSITHQPSDLDEAVKTLRESIKDERALGTSEEIIVQTDVYQELLTLKQQGAIPSVE